MRPGRGEGGVHSRGGADRGALLLARRPPAHALVRRCTARSRGAVPVRSPRQWRARDRSSGGSTGPQIAAPAWRLFFTLPQPHCTPTQVGRPARTSLGSLRACRGVSTVTRYTAVRELYEHYPLSVSSRDLYRGVISSNRELPFYMRYRGGARVGGSVSLVNVTLLSSIMWRCHMPRARLERMVPSRRGHV